MGLVAVLSVAAAFFFQGKFPLLLRLSGNNDGAGPLSPKLLLGDLLLAHNSVLQFYQWID